MGSGEDAQFVFAKYDYTAQGNQVILLSDWSLTRILSADWSRSST